ncbi:MAG: patatin-like phospholipase family protein [Robiginitomaculum sp.]|nr:patatin-like phospholipase family protein [Robiginitomaculum sp.]MDQ7076623.1 patatin-like phospholipase family protein [Robiginitomaculum sp.]
MPKTSSMLTAEDLAGISILADAPKGALKAAAKKVEWFSLPGGRALFKPGDPADSIYFLRSGVLGAFSTGEDGSMDFIGHIRAGEPVGEMAFLGGAPHSSAIFAMRDSEIIRLPREAFEKLIKRFPTLMRSLAQMMVLRMRINRRDGCGCSSEPKVFALLGTSPTINCEHVARMLSEALSKLGRSSVIVGPEGEDSDSEWFDELERSHDVVLLHAPVADTHWFRLCLRQADRLWILARPDARPSEPLLPPDRSPARMFRLVDVLLLHNHGERVVSDGCDWKRAASAERVFHWKQGSKADVARIARTAAGRSIGLVLSGGGARSYAHIGAIRALREAGIPIDFTGGTSMGAIIAAGLALGWDDDYMEKNICDAFVHSNPLNDYTLPVVALTRGRKVNRRLERFFGDIRIENLTIPYFCVSSNLGNGCASIHREGLLRTALRASISLPGILPPVVIKGDVHVDGAVVNNFPADVMGHLHRGLTVGVDVARQKGLNVDDFIDPPGFFGWVLRYGLQEAPPIASLLMRTATITHHSQSAPSENVDVLVLPDVQDVELRDWKAYDVAVEAGYRAMVQALKEGALERLTIK